ncbi:MAG: hypothetical protein NTZ83_05710 [Candidatus Pacearchaeota archaeon]|nr:hypothetical protein [Candidatus Pacearchaeota archaeon]
MRKLEKENRRKMKFRDKKTSKRIRLHQIELKETRVIMTASFHTDPNNFGFVKEITNVPYSIGLINIRNLFY